MHFHDRSGLPLPFDPPDSISALSLLNCRVMQLAGRKLILGVSGGIAAYKSADLVRRLKEAGVDVQVVMTASAQEFVSALTFQALSGRAVRTQLFDAQAEAAMGHIELARWADAIIIAPASADLLARLAHGFANDLLTTLCLATAAPVMVAPAMNQQMWRHAATQANVATLAQHGVRVLGPAEGSQACGDVGLGRMLEPLEIVQQLSLALAPGYLHGLRVMITAGPTREPLDPVRYIGNRSSGRMGYALAQAAHEAGADVTLVSGPVTLATPNGVHRRDVETAVDMQTAVMSDIATQHIFIGCAAVADYRPVQAAPQKIKKDQARLAVELVRNPDVLASVAALPEPPFTVGFAAETQRLEEAAAGKLTAKRLHMIAANAVGEGSDGFGSDYNALLVLWNGGRTELPRTDKLTLARQLIQLIHQRYVAIRQ